MNITVNIPDVAQVIVTGPTQCGKSIIAERIRQVLSDEFGATAVVAQPDPASGGCAEWERKIIRDTLWVVSEKNQPRLV